MKKITYTVSARKKPNHLTMEQHLDLEYPFVPKDQIESIFGFSDYMPMYGGKLWQAVEVTEADLSWMYDRGIGYRIPLSNLRITEQDYKNNLGFFHKFHRSGNSIIAVQDWLAERIKNDFPFYAVEASTIKRVRTLEEISSALKVFDTVVPASEVHADYDLLNQIEQKDRIRLFMRAGCAFYCQNRICYTAYSNYNRKESTPLVCGTNIQSFPPEHRVTYFEVDRYLSMGFTKFKAHTPEAIRGNNLRLGPA